MSIYLSIYLSTYLSMYLKLCIVVWPEAPDNHKNLQGPLKLLE